MGGAATFSPVCTVRFDGAAGALRLTAAPNPFRERLMLTVELPAGLASAPAPMPPAAPCSLSPRQPGRRARTN